MENKKFKVSVLAMSVGSVLLSGCSSTHTEKWNEADQSFDKNEVKFNQAQEQIKPKDRPLTKIVDDFYVDTAPMAIIKEDKTSLPSIFYSNFTMLYKDRPVALNDIAGEIYVRTGLSINFINNEKIPKKEDSKDETEKDGDVIPPPTPYFDPSQAAQKEEIIYDDKKEEETADNIYIDHQGTLKQLLDFIAVKKGLKWKYDQSSNKIFIYKYDTRTFTIMGFGEEIERDNKITTSMGANGSGGSEQSASSTANEQSITIKAKTAYWNGIKGSIKDLVSLKGSVTFNDVQGKIIVTDNDFVLSSIDSLVENLNKDAFREIMLDVKVINLTITDKRNIDASINIKGINDKFNIGFGSAIDLLNIPDNTVSFDDGKTSAMLQMLDHLGKAKVENSINVVTMNNMPVPLQLTQNRSYLKQISTEEDSDSGNETTEVEVGLVAEGITMTATPKAVGQNVMLDYSLNLSTIDSIEKAPGDVQVQLPITSAKNFIQRTNLRNGVPRVIATIERNVDSNDSTHPLNENLWMLGGSEGVNNKKDVLMVIVTPYITDLNK